MTVNMTKQSGLDKSERTNVTWGDRKKPSVDQKKTTPPLNILIIWLHECMQKEWGPPEGKYSFCTDRHDGYFCNTPCYTTHAVEKKKESSTVFSADSVPPHMISFMEQLLMILNNRTPSHISQRLYPPWDQMCFDIHFYLKKTHTHCPLNSFWRGYGEKMEKWSSLFHRSCVLKMIHPLRISIRSDCPPNVSPQAMEAASRMLHDSSSGWA